MIKRLKENYSQYCKRIILIKDNFLKYYYLIIIKDSQKIFIMKESATASNTVLLQYRGRKKEICEDQNLSLTS